MADGSEVVKEGEQAQVADSEGETKRWTSALILTGLLLTLFFIAFSLVRLESGDVDQACFERTLSDEHALMEAAFQNPPEQGAIVQAMQACSRSRCTIGSASWLDC